MEATTLNIANLALVDAQNQNLVSSDMVVFRRPAEKNLKFQQMAIEAQSSKEGNETTHRRVQRMRDQFSDPGKTCLKRTLLQLQARFPKVTRESMAYLLLDPRMKHAAKTIATVGNVPRKEEKALYTGGMDYLRDVHHLGFGTMTKEGGDPVKPGLWLTELQHL
ncbi:hypothetical protein PC110_g6832 [Phytophthora cactorum]|uniref:Uncharacterized protein n=1 Tax=Phytophthora cactorum TaxID=29920 RepID=A0A329SJX2_9STRA|nr:hypothetical protein PC110_g6832 [Phytophthora cactorum]